MRNTGQYLRATIAALPLSIQLMAQVAYPPFVVQDETWTSGTHHVAVTQPVLAPGSDARPLSISGTADAELKSGTAVHLAPGFHAGNFSNNGYFHAYIDPALGAPGDVVVIAPDPATHISGNVLHVNKWEKLEVGLQLPQAYKVAIDSFFVHYYADPLDPYVATPANVDPVHDLNPYADDSLQVVMTLTKPDGTQSLKWGFFMREAKWENNSATAQLTEDLTDPLHPYHIRFRLAPDMEGAWQCTISTKAPHTTTLGNAPLNNLLYTGYSFVCEPPLPDNHGPLHVNDTNRRTLQFEDGTSFFGLGLNMADLHHWFWGGLPSEFWWSTFYKRDFDVMKRSMDQLASVGGNYLRMFLLRHIFAPEWVNLGVYDAFKVAPTCQQNFSDSCNVQLTDDFTGNCQSQCWAFDQMVDKARENNTYLQLCIDPYTTGFGYETFLWGPHPYVRNFVEPSSATRPYNVREFFFAGGDPANTGSGVFYYWKRKYKYLMARWGYSVHIPIIEPFNEVDGMLGYQGHDLSGGNYCDVCPENRVNWPQEDGLRPVINTWLTDIADHVRNPVNVNDPVHSPLGESDKLFLVSYASGNVNDQSYFLPFTNPKVDLLDVHKYIWPNPGQAGQPDDAMAAVFDHAQAFRSQYPSTNTSVPRKPFNHGESNYFTDLPFGTDTFNIEQLFHNYDVSFHNELWSSAFSGNFATGLTWHWERVFWWPDALPKPPADPDNQFQGVRTNLQGATNILDIGEVAIPVVNRTIHHHFKPLAELLANPDWGAYGLLNTDYSPHKVYDAAAGIECYYLLAEDQTAAIGWVHNLNAWVMNSYYLASGQDYQNFLGCTGPASQTVSLSGLQPGMDYHITWFPTRMNMSELPDDQLDPTGTGTVTLDMSSEPLGSIANSYLDTLHADYAFIITPQPIQKMAEAEGADDTGDSHPDGSFDMYPNPADNTVTLLFPADEGARDITLYDLTGKRVLSLTQVTDPLVQLPTGHLGRGVYCVRVFDGGTSRTKTLILR